MKTVAGLDVGGTKIEAVAVDDDGQVLATERLATSTGGSEPVYQSIRTALDRLLDAVGLTRFDGIGVGIPGIVERDRGEVTMAVNLGIGTSCLAVRDRLSEDYQTVVRVENDVNAAALGVFLNLSRQAPLDNLVYLSVGTGVAAGLVLNRRLYRGRTGFAGELGHVPTPLDDGQCPCGQTGCLENVVSGRGLASLCPPSIPMSDFYRRVAEGDVEATGAADLFADRTAALIQVVTLAYDPDVIVIGGGIAGSGPPFFATVDQALHRLESTSPFLASLSIRRRVRPSPKGPMAAVGAASLVVAPIMEAVV